MKARMNSQPNCRASGQLNGMLSFFLVLPHAVAIDRINTGGQQRLK